MGAQEKPPIARPCVPVFPSCYSETSRALLDSAIGFIPAYQSWQPFRRSSVCSIDECFSDMPVLTKKELREFFPHGFITPGLNLDAALATEEVEFVKTSGTTSEAVTNVWYQPWWDASESASWSLNTATAGTGLGNHREAILSSPRCVGVIAETGTLSMEQRTDDRFLFLNEKLNPADWYPLLCDRMLDELGRFQPVLLEANPSLLSLLCRHALHAGRSACQPAAVILTYENPSQIHLRHIQSVFKCPVISSYGSTEAGYVFMQCEAGKFHQNIDYCRVDFQPLKPEHGGPWIGRILVSTFHNPWRVLLRFDVGDLVRVSESSCSCGRTMGYTLDAIEGRSVNVTLRTDGTLVTQRTVDGVIGSIHAIAQYQLNQTATASYRIRYVLEDGISAGGVEQSLIKKLMNLYGSSAEIQCGRVDFISPESSGKYRLARADFEIDIEEYLA